MTRRRRWIIGLLCSAIGLLLIGWLLLIFALPFIIEKQIASLFRKAGFENAKFELQSASLWKTNLATISAGKDEWLKIGNVAIEYSPVEVFNGDISSVRIRDAKLIVSLDDLMSGNSDSNSGSSFNARIPIASIEMQSCVLVLKRGDMLMELPLDGTLLRTPSGTSQLNVRATHDGASIAIAGTIDPTSNGKADVTADASGMHLAAIVSLLPDDLRKNFSSAAGTIDLKAEHHRGGATTQPITSLNLEINEGKIVGKGDYEGELTGLFSKVKISNTLPLQIPPGQWLTFATLKISGQELSHGRVVFEASSSDNLRIADAQVSWAGGRFKADPFDVAMSTGNISTIISADHVDLAQALTVITQGKAEGTGRISGKVPLAYDGVRFKFGDGDFLSEGPGTMRLADSAAPYAKSLNQQALQALQDFQYDTITSGFKHEGAEQVISVKLKGRGRTGTKQPFDITLNFRGIEQSINAYLEARPGVLKDVKGAN